MSGAPSLRRSAKESLGRSKDDAIPSNARLKPVSLSKTLPSHGKQIPRQSDNLSLSNRRNVNSNSDSNDFEEPEIVYRLRTELEEALKIIEQQSITIQKLEDALRKSEHRTVSTHSSIEVDLERTALNPLPRDIARCLTCGTTNNLEEDQDNPGMIYCTSCWNNYEVIQDSPSIAGHAVHPRSVAQSVSQSLSLPPSASKNNEIEVETLSDFSIWIFHDNPRLSDLISAAQSIQALMEAKISTSDYKKYDPACSISASQITLMIIGSVSFTGPQADYTHNNDDRLTRGSYITILSDVQALVIDVQNAQTSANQEGIVSVCLDFDAKSPFSISCNNRPLLTRLLKSCTDRIDIIFKPQRSGNWFPYFEGSKKLAPQFRSKHLGYLRLGDDMSKFGAAFLSIDEGMTFVSNYK